MLEVTRVEAIATSNWKLLRWRPLIYIEREIVLKIERRTPLTAACQCFDPFYLTESSKSKERKHSVRL